MKPAVTSAVLLACLVVGSHAALAHPGNHSHLDWLSLGGHLLEADHLAFAALIVAVGVLAFSAGRRAEARARDRSKP